MKTTVRFALGLILLLGTSNLHAQFDCVTNPDNTLTITNYSGGGGAVTIPPTYNGLTVSAIGPSAFNFKTAVTSVNISSTVSNIGDYAFYGCLGLTNAALPSFLGNIGNSVFELCRALPNITLPPSITSIGVGAFQSCSALNSIVLPGGITNIGSSAFYNCQALTSVMMPPSVRSLGLAAFNSCSKLQRIVLPPGIRDIPGSAFYGCSGLTNAKIMGPVTNIEAEAFYNCTSLGTLFFRGNAPAVDSTAFLSASMPTVYYVPGTTGWSNFAAATGFTCVLWNPTIQAGAGISNGQFGFTIGGTPNVPFVVAAAGDLGSGNWNTVQSFAPSASAATFSDSSWKNFTARYYQVVFP